VKAGCAETWWCQEPPKALHAPAGRKARAAYNSVKSLGLCRARVSPETQRRVGGHGAAGPHQDRRCVLFEWPVLALPRPYAFGVALEPDVAADALALRRRPVNVSGFLEKLARNARAFRPVPRARKHRVLQHRFVARRP